jgi:hypothetical protein
LTESQVFWYTVDVSTIVTFPRTSAVGLTATVISGHQRNRRKPLK